MKKIIYLTIKYSFLANINASILVFFFAACNTCVDTVPQQP